MSCSMSEGMSPILTSNQPLKQRAPKRSREEDSDSGGSTGRSRCRYQGCGRRTRRGRGEFCGHAHKNFFMANLADDGGAAGSSRVKGQQQMDGVCMLPSCNLKVEVEHGTGYPFDFCTREHYREYIQICTPQWAEVDRLCKWEDCFNHVRVYENPKKFDEFCREKCAERFSARRGLSLAESPGTSDAAKVDEKGPSSEEIPKESTSQEASEHVHEKHHKTRGYHGKQEVSPEYIEKCLEDVVLHLKDPSGQLNRGTDVSEYLQFRDLVKVDPGGKFSTGIHIYKYHPWELNDSKGDKARYFLFMYDSARKAKRTTRKLYAWKQSGQPRKVLTLIERYFSYKFRGKNDTSNDHLGGPSMSYCLQTGRVKSRWTMHEYYLSHDAIKLLTGGCLPRYRPMICKICENKEGEPVSPPTRQDRVETPAIDAITEARNAGVSLETIPDPVLPSGDMEVDFATLLRDGTPLTPDSDSPPKFEETGELDVATRLDFFPNTPLTSDSDSPPKFEETGELDFATLLDFFLGTPLNPDSYSPPKFEETGELDVATLLVPDFHQTVDDMRGSEFLFKAM